LPEAIRRKMVEGRHLGKEDTVTWQRILHARGWAVPHWPVAWGGCDWTPVQQYIFLDEMQQAPAPPPLPFGVSMVGPVIIEFGSDAQKRRFLPRIASLEDWWCQGFSEPGAGSDLASLQMKAEDKGDHYLVNGSKIWTSGGQWADMCFALVRTDNTKKHEGISFLLIDMHDPGVEVRPIRLIAGASPFCETFFTDVKVPKENLVGPLNGGWTIAKRLLQHERSGIGGGGSGGGGGNNIFGVGGSPAAAAKDYVGTDEAGRIDDPDLRSRIIGHEMDAKAFQLTAFRMMAESRSNQGPSAATSIMKNAGTKVGQDRAELLLEVMGTQGLGWAGDDFTSNELSTVRGWLGGKATTIFGGSQEIQSNIISKRILGLPDPLGPSSN
jgi:alkylation response protein AidB-like acyl-CoA dehydrogenase